MGNRSICSNQIPRTPKQIATAPYPSGVPVFLDDDDKTTVRIDTREMSFTAEASMFIDTNLVMAG